MQSHQGTKVELGSLQQLNLADVYLYHTLLAPICRRKFFRRRFDHLVGVSRRGSTPEDQTYVLERVDARGGLLDLAANDLGNELRGELGEGAAGGFALDDVGHLAADGTDLGRSSVGGLLDLVLATLGEADGEEADEVVVGGLDGDVGLNQGLPLADERSKLVGCEVEAVESSQAALALDLVDAEANLAERVALILLEISERDLDDASLEGIVGVLQTGGAVDEGLADTVQRVSTSGSCRKLFRVRRVESLCSWSLTLER